MYSGVAIGFSSFTYHDNSINDGKFEGSGPAYKLILASSRFYLSKHFGLGAIISISGYSYKNGIISNKYGDLIDFEITGNGTQLAFMLSYKW